MRRPEPRVVGAAVLVAAGAAVVQGMGGELTAEGLAAAIGALACEAAFSLLAAPLLKPLGPVAVSAWAAILAVPQLIVVGLILDGPGNLIRTPTLAEAAALAYLTVVVTAMAFVLWYSAVRTLGVERAGLLSGVLPRQRAAGRRDPRPQRADRRAAGRGGGGRRRHRGRPRLGAHAAHR